MNIESVATQGFQGSQKENRHSRWYVEKIATFFGWNIQTVRETLHRWRRKGLEGLRDAPGRGKTARWNASDLEFLEQCLRGVIKSESSCQKMDRSYDV
jgi:Homeodomain-like domain